MSKFIAGDMAKEVLWTDIVGTLQQGPKGPYWAVKDSQLKHWSLQVHQRDRRSPFQLTFVYRIEKSWIPNPGNPITIAAVGTKDKLDVSVLEGVEERVLSIDCKKHTFHLEPFLESISSLPSEDKADIEKIIASGVSKRAINFILDTLGDLNAKVEAEYEASTKKKKKQAENVLQARAQDGGSSKSKKTKKGLQNPDVEDTRSTPDALKRTDVVALSTPMEEDNLKKTPAAKKQPAAKRASSPARKTKSKKLKAKDEETPMVLTAAEKGRVISHGEEPSLEEAAQDRKKFI